MAEKNRDRENNYQHLIDNFDSDGVILILEGRFNFIYYKNLLGSLECFNKKTVIIDFSQILYFEVDYLSEYENFTRKLQKLDYDLYVTGLPKERIIKDLLMKDVNWIQCLFKNRKILFKS